MALVEQIEEAERKLETIQRYRGIMRNFSEMDQAMLTTFVELLDGVSADQTERAFQHIAKRQRDFPTPYEVIETAEALMTFSEREQRDEERRQRAEEHQRELVEQIEKEEAERIGSTKRRKRADGLRDK